MSKKATQKRVKVLYQNLNGVWYAFADIGEDIYFGKVPLKASAKKGAKAKTSQRPAAKKPSKAA